MTKNRYTFLIFIIPIILLGFLNYGFMRLANQEASTFESRVRFLAIAQGQDDRIDALPEIYIEGEINDIILKEFEETVARHDLYSGKVVFNSTGGNLDDAIKLGYLIRSKGFSTAVGKYTQTWDEPGAAGCYSACTVAFLGGKYRYFTPPSEFGVHQYRSVGIRNDINNRLESDAQRFSGEFLEYIQEMGIETDFYKETVFQEHDDVELLSLDELVKMNVVNNGAFPAEWKIVMDGSTPVLLGEQKRIGQDGSTTIRCNQGPGIIFRSNRKALGEKDKNALKFSLYTDEQEISIDGMVQSEVVTGLESHLLATFKPNTNSLLAILGSDTFGLIYEDADGTRFIHNIDITKDRSQISEFIRNCHV